MASHKQLSDAFKQVVQTINSKPIQRPTQSSRRVAPLSRPSPMESLNVYEESKRFDVPRSKAEFLGDLDKRLDLFAQGIGQTLEILDANGRISFPRAASVLLTLPTELKMQATPNSFSFSAPTVNGAPSLFNQTHELSYQDLRQLPAVETLLDMAKEANVDLTFKFFFNGSARAEDISKTTGTLHGHDAQQMIISFNLQTPFDPGKYPTIPAPGNAQQKKPGSPAN